MFPKQGSTEPPAPPHFCFQNKNLSKLSQPSSHEGLVRCLLSLGQLTSGCSSCGSSSPAQGEQRCMPTHLRSTPTSTAHRHYGTRRSRSHAGKLDHRLRQKVLSISSPRSNPQKRKTSFIERAVIYESTPCVILCYILFEI